MLIAERFAVLAHPLRVRLICALGEGKRSVTDLVASTGVQQATVSKQLQLLHRANVLDRRRSGTHVFYSVSDPTIVSICGCRKR